MHRSLEFKRHIFNNVPSRPSVYMSPMNSDESVLNFKAMMRRSPNRFAIKVGIFQSSGRVGQALQGAASIAIPGDFSDVRSPVRSRAYAAATPGGGVGGIGGVGAPGREERGYRCPEGFQYGGRFTDNRFSTCGQMLFDIFALGRTIGQEAEARRERLRALGPETQAETIPGVQPQADPLIISRAAQIPRVGNANPEARQAAVTEAVDALRDADNSVNLLVRRDGFALRPVVSSAILRTVPDNRNMEGGTYLTAVNQLDSLGGEELGLLSNTGITELKYVMPEGVTISMTKDRELTVGERRALGRIVNDAAKLDNSDDPLARLKRIADGSNGGITIQQDMGSIKAPNDFVEVDVNGTKKRVRSWVKELFMSGREAPQGETESEDVAEDAVEESDEMITSLSEAIKHLDAGGDPSRIIGSLLPEALERSESYTARRTLIGSTAFENADGSSLRRYTSSQQYQHLAVAAGADIAKALGLDTQDVYPSVGGARMPYVVSSVRNQNTDAVMNPTMSDVTPESMARLAVFDFLVDQGNRDERNTYGLRSDGKINIATRPAKESFAVGLPRNQASSRMRRQLDAVWKERNVQFYSEYFAALSAQQRRSVLELLEQLLKNAQQYSFERLMQRMALNGEITQAERSHLNIMRSIFESRVDILESSMDRFAALIGVGRE